MANFLGGIWPVVQRELREGARRPVNHRLRFWSAVGGTVLLWVVVVDSDRSAAQLGGWLFASLHTLLLGLIVMIVPALTADCLAREKREGTLGLLFLTPLNAGGVVAGKALAQALRAFTLWLAVLPVLAIPFMTGGVAWFDAFSALSLEFCATLLCLAAGLLASALAKERNTAFLLAYLLAALFLLLFGQFFQFILFVGWRGFAVVQEAGWWRLSVEQMVLFSGLLDYRSVAGWSFLAVTSVRLGNIWKCLCLAGPPVVLMIFYLTARFAARRIGRSWQDRGPSARRESLLRRYCTPLFRRRFRRAMQRSLDRNPIAWLQQYSWKARMSKWGLCLAFLLVEWAIPRDLRSEPGMAQLTLLAALGAIYTFVGVSGFLEEKRSGALELLLVTPISVNTLIYGRVRGLWSQFLPASMIWAGFFAIWQWNREGSSLLFVYFDLRGPFVVLTCLFLTLPVFATYFALRVKNLIVAAALTWTALWLPIYLVGEAGQLYIERNAFGVSHPLQIDFLTPGILEILLSYGAFALLACFLLRHSLSRRIYSF